MRRFFWTLETSSLCLRDKMINMLTNFEPFLNAQAQTVSDTQPAPGS